MSEQHFQICHFCQRNVKIAYYCENCGVSCCSDCLHEEKIDSYVCQDCNSKNIALSGSSKQKICNDCGKENIIKTNQLLKSCPKCHSHQVINIYEKKEDLEKQFLELIKDARSFIDPFRDIVNSLYMIRQKVLDARAPPIRCYHYPKMESDLLALFKLFIYAKETLLEKIHNFIQHLSINKEYFFNIYTQQNSNIRIIEDILENLNRSYNSITDFIQSNVKTINTSIDNILKNLIFIDKITFYFKNYIKFLNLADDEKPVYAIYAKLANGLNTQDKYKKDKGILFITNFDLSFVHEYGRLKRKQKGIFKAPVKDLTSVKIKGKLFKRLYIEFPYGRYEFTLPTNSISRVLDYILLARSFDETIVYDKVAAKKLNDIDVDLSDLTNYIEETINSFFSIKCQYNNVNSNNVFVNNHNANSLLNQNLRNLPNPNSLQAPYNQNQPTYPNNFSYPFNIHQNYKNIPGNPSLYQKNEGFSNHGFGQIPTPEDLNHFGNTRRHYIPPNYNQNEFFLQNLYESGRIQNYDPISSNSGYKNNFSDVEEKNFLMRKLEQSQRYGAPSSNPLYRNNFDERSYEPTYNRLNERFRQMPQYNEYSRNHLSELFNNDNMSNQPNDLPRPNSKKMNKTRRKKMFELEKEKYSLEETLKTLESKFESGNISEIDFFKNFKNLQKDFYTIDKSLESIDEEMQEEDFLRRNAKNFDRKKYFT